MKLFGIKPLLWPTLMTLPAVLGALALGTWQGIYLWEHRTHAHRRHITLHLLGE